MLANLAKINVLIVTYKHQDVIGRTIESVIAQKSFGLNKIIICDDCSPDNNWQVISSYVDKYPEIIIAYHNETNLGIYGNSDKLVTLRGDADLFCWLEGDDALCEGFFENIQNTIQSRRIDITRKVGICCDWKIVFPTGKEMICSNYAAEEASLSPISMYFRELVTWRGSVFSSSVLNEFQPTRLDMGLNLAETLFDSQFFSKSDALYYSECMGTIYYAQVGISTSLGSGSAYMNEETVIKARYFIENYPLTRCDKFWWKYILYRTKNRMEPSLLHFSKAFLNYLIGVYRGKGCRKNRLRKYIIPLFKGLLKIN